jgi:predicted GTPase
MENKISPCCASLCSEFNTTSMETNIELQQKLQYQVYNTSVMVPEVHSVVASSELKYNLGCSPSAL